MSLAISDDLRAPTRATTRRLRVMHLVRALRAGGMEHGVVKLVNRLDRDRFQASVCSFQPADSLGAALAADIPLFQFRCRNGNDPIFVGRLIALLARHRPDIVHTHCWGTLCEGLIAARLARVPHLVHGEHGTLESRPRNRAIQRWGWRRADRVLAVSSRLAARMAQEMGFPVDRIRTIRNGVELSRFARPDRSAARVALGIAPGEFVVGTAGRLVPVKDHDSLLSALSLLKGDGLPVTAIIAGDGPLRATLGSRARELGLADTVRFVGNRPDIENVLTALDLFVLPSRSEGLSNTILEAMAAGLAVVATAVGGADELVLDSRTGLLVPPQAAGALARAIRALATDPAMREAMAARGRQRAEAEFSLERMVREYEDLYLDLAGAVRGTAPVLSPVHPTRTES